MEINKKILIIIIVVIAIVGAGVGIYYAKGNKTTKRDKTTVSAKDMLYIEYQGKNGDGRTTVIFDPDKLINFICTVIGISEEELSDPSNKSDVDKIQKAVKIRQKEYKDLSNGDKIKVIVDIDEKVAKEYNFEVTDLESEHEVLGLE